MKHLLVPSLLLALAVGGLASEVAAWGATGHRIIGVEAVRALPDEIPAFLRNPAAAAGIGELAREPDRWKGAGQPHDRERDTAHFVNLREDGRVMVAGGPHNTDLPRLKSEYDAALIAAGTDVDTAGYLPYALMDGYQQLVRNLGYWRVLSAAEARETDPGKHAWYREDRVRREALILRDLGVLAHYIGDASQPLHVSIHYNGWAEGEPNPEGFTTSRRTHSLFEGAFVRRNVRAADVAAAMPVPRLDGFELRASTAAYLLETLAGVTPFYRLEKAGAFVDGDPRGIAFATERLAAGAAVLRDWTVLAWLDSADERVGWPAVSVAEVEAGTADPWDAMVGTD